MTLNLSAFTLEHLEAFEARGDVIVDVAEACKEMIDSHHLMMFTVLHENLPIMFLCVQFIRENVGEITVYPSNKFVSGAEFLKDFFGKSKGVLHALMDQLKLTRLQASIDTSEPKFVRWIEGFGFEREGTMKNFGGVDKSYYLYGYGGGK